MEAFSRLVALLSLLAVCLADIEDDSEEESSTHIPHVLSQSVNSSVRKGETAIFDCRVDSIGSFVKVWKKGDKVFFSNKWPVYSDARIKLDGESLRVINVTEDDAGEYTCEISTLPPITLLHRLVVVVTPTVTTFPPDGVLTVVEGSGFSVGCQVTGLPTPVVSWTHSTGMTADDEREGDFVKVRAAEKRHDGHYTCTAKNDFDTVSANIRVIVQHGPNIRVPEGVVYTGIGADALLICAVSGRPAPRVTWKDPRGNSRPSDRWRQEPSGECVHRLSVRKVGHSDLGEYVCLAENRLGTSHRSVLLSGLAAPAELAEDASQSGPDRVLVRWWVKSHGPVLQYLLKFRRTDISDDRWSEVPVPAERQRSLLRSQSYEISGLQPGATYQVQVLTRNEFGWSLPGRPWLFSTPGSIKDGRQDKTKNEEDPDRDTPFYTMKFADQDATPLPDSQDTGSAPVYGALPTLLWTAVVGHLLLR